MPPPGGLSIVERAADRRDAVLQPAQAAAGVEVGAADAVVGDDHDELPSPSRRSSTRALVASA